MPESFKRGIIVCLALMAATPVVALADDATDDEAYALGQRTFAMCRACHSLEEGGPHKVGPNLWHLFGRSAASAEGFTRYSKAMKESGIVWNAETLGSYLENPRKAVPGTNMAFAGVRDAAKRAALISYLEKETAGAE